MEIERFTAVHLGRQLCGDEVDQATGSYRPTAERRAALASCVAFGMPEQAIKLGAVDRVMPLCRCAAGPLGRLDGVRDADLAHRPDLRA